MVFPCRDENCKKLFSTKYNRNKHEKKKGHGPQLQGKPKILSIENLYYCPTNGCTVKSKYKASIVKHLKLCVTTTTTTTKWKTAAKNKTCPICQKVFPQKWNHNRQVQNAHQSLEDDIVDVDDMLNDNLPSVVFADDAPTKIFQSLAIPENPVNHRNQEETVPLPIDDEDDSSRRNEMERKQSRLEKTVTKMKMELGYSINVSESVLEKLKVTYRTTKKKLQNALMIVLKKFLMIRISLDG